MRILVIKHGQHPKFIYQRFLSAKAGTYDTKSNSIEEACGCEIVMARYIYSVGFVNSAAVYARSLRNGLLTNFANAGSSASDVNAGLQVIEAA